MNPRVAPPPSAVTDRLLHSLHALQREEDVALSRGDWPALNEVLVRERALVARLARHGDRPSPEIIAAVRRLRDRYQQLADRLHHSRQELGAELQSLRRTRGRTRDIQHAYRRSA